MPKFNTPTVRPAVTSPVLSEPSPTGFTHEGGAGYARDAKSELFLLAVSNMVGEATFYEAKRERDERFRSLIHAIAPDDPTWMEGLIQWLRGEANMRSAAVVAAVEAVKCRLDAGLAGNRGFIDAACQRADEPGEVLAYWVSRYGRAIPKPVKRGVADAVTRLYTERSLLKYDTPGKGYRFGDVIDLCHPAASAPWQGDLYRHALDRRHQRDNPIPDRLRTLRARADLMALPVDKRYKTAVNDAARLRDAGMTWQALAGWLQGPMDKNAWQSIIPDMGYMALLRNLRNFDEARVPDDVAAQIATKLADPAEVAQSRQLPMRFLSAFRAAPSLRWAYALETALNLSLENVPVLEGRTLVLVDRSGSMFDPMSARSDLTRADAAAIFGTALTLRCMYADLVEFGTTHRKVTVGKAESVLRVLDRFTSLGGTNTADAVRATYRPGFHDRVVIVTDEQAMFGYYGTDPTAQVPPEVPVYTWNLAGYEHGHGPSGTGQRHTFGGLSDAAFKMIPLLEAGRDSAWPF